MAKEIRETPLLTGKDAENFVISSESPESRDKNLDISEDLYEKMKDSIENGTSFSINE